MSWIQIFFCKYPVKGKVKTRLARSIGNNLSVEIYVSILQNVIQNFPRENTIIFLDKESYAFELENPFYKKFFPDINIFVQKGKNLGEKMAYAFLEIYKKYPEKKYIFLAGSDIPEYNFKIVKNIYKNYNKYDCVIIPSNDGGYSMIGFSINYLKNNNKNFIKIFKNIDWSTSKVLDQQIHNFKNFNIFYKTLNVLGDLDTYDDLKKFIYLDYLKNIVQRVYVLIPVLNEEENLKIILPLLKENPFIKEIICIDNGSDDNSKEVAEKNGATVVTCKEKGYGAALLEGIQYLKRKSIAHDSILLFMDGDGSDDPSEINKIMLPLFNKEYDIVLGDRTNSNQLLLHQKLGNLLATFLIYRLWKYKFNDLGPMRSIYWNKLLELNMQDRNFGWTIEMQIKAIQKKLRIKEVPVNYKKRIYGKSKVSGTIRGSILAGKIILKTIIKEKWKERFLYNK